MSIPNTNGLKRRQRIQGRCYGRLLPDYNLTVSSLAKEIGVSRQSINELLRERRSVSPEMALRLARLFGNSPEFWLNAQRAVDLWGSRASDWDDVARIQPLVAA
ncbi:MAG: HigA family addiction module antidote protein [Chloroflexi bacterium]|nr:HigA family addiction module antidote protein [Chloroflexota bacterium]